MKRHFIVLGDTTTAGGTVKQGEDKSPLQGKPLSYHGAEVYCSACKSVGHISGVAPFRPMKLFGKQIALENDLCMCQCNPPPKLVASQQVAYMSFDSDGAASAGGTGATPQTSQQFDDHYVILDRNERPIANKAYGIRRANGSMEYGTTDAKGHTHLLSTTAESENIQVYLEA